MKLPILNKLRDGERFDLEVLLSNVEQIDEFWNLWWENRSFAQIDRPETIADGDPVLELTSNKDRVDLNSWPEFHHHFLNREIQRGAINRHTTKRSEFREQVITRLAKCSTTSGGEKIVVFAGGGYGSGKTTCLKLMASRGCLPLTDGAMTGVDYVKLHIPEFSLIQSAADGRASSVVQEECKQMSNTLFERLIESRASFIWDSSMSNNEESMAKILLCKNAGYTMHHVGVLTRPEYAIRLAMERAKCTKRFPNARYLPLSHVGYRKHLNDYLPFFDKVSIFANVRYGKPQYELARKEDGSNKLEVFDQGLFESLLRYDESIKGLQ